MEDVTEGNKLISKFMNERLRPENLISNETKGKKLWVDLINRELGTQIPPYNKSWDWLMPVVIKISKDFDVRLSSCGLWVFTIDRKDCDWEDKSVAEMGGYEDPIMNVWEAVVRFITWYNKQPKYKKKIID